MVFVDDNLNTWFSTGKTVIFPPHTLLYVGPIWSESIAGKIRTTLVVLVFRMTSFRRLGCIQNSPGVQHDDIFAD